MPCFGTAKLRSCIAVTVCRFPNVEVGNSFRRFLTDIAMPSAGGSTGARAPRRQNRQERVLLVGSRGS